MCFICTWEQTATCATCSINGLVFITEFKSVYCAVRTGSLNKAVCASTLNRWSSRLFLNSRIYPNGLHFFAFDTSRFFSSSSILTCKKVAARKDADEYCSYAIIRGFEPWSHKNSCLNWCVFSFCPFSKMVVALIYELFPAFFSPTFNYKCKNSTLH